MPLSIDDVTVDELEEVIAMAQELSAHEGMPPAELTVDGLREVLFGPHPLLFGRVARVGEAVAGYALWTVGYTMQHGKPLLETVDLYVRPAFRRKRIARALMQDMAGVAQKQGYRFLRVITFDGNVEANAFYPAIGGELDRTKVYAFGQRAMAKLIVDNTQRLQGPLRRIPDQAISQQFTMGKCMATLYMLMGLPGAGKTTVGKRLERECPALLLSPDVWMARIVRDGYDAERRRAVQQLQLELADRVLRLGRDVVSVPAS